MARQLIDIKKLNEFLDEGKTGRQIAAFFNVSPQAVSKAAKKIDRALTINVITETAPAIANDKLDAIGQLKKISRSINTELDYIEREIKGKKGKERETLQEQKIKHAAEIRKQVNLMTYIATTLYNIEEVAKFQQTVLEVIGEINEEARKKIIKKLRDRITSKSVLSLS